MRKLVMGDIHGGFKALVQCFERSNFDYKVDQLIQLGDIVDGYPEVFECVDELMKIRNLISIKGNHDDWFNEFISTEYHPYYWTYGGKGTLISYLNHVGKDGQYLWKGKGFKTALQSQDIPKEHKEFFANQLPFYIDDEQRCFVHAGFNRSLPFEQQPLENYYWDRSLWSDAVSLSASKSVDVFSTIPIFKDIYIGHTPTTNMNCDKPISKFNITNVDTGASSNGRLTILDLESKQFWQSDPLRELYSDYS